MRYFKQLLWAILLLNATYLFAQKNPIKFGKLSESETAMTVYEQDSSAAAVILCSYSDTYYNYLSTIGSFHIVQTIHYRIKILKKEAYHLADVRILYPQNSSYKYYFSDLKAIAHNLENGKWVETKMDKSSIFEENVSKRWKAKKFTIPNVKEGTILEYTYQLETDNYLNCPDWTFQSEYPVKWSEYRLNVPNYFEFTFNQEGFHRCHINEKEADNIDGINAMKYRWAMKDLPALKDEPYTPRYQNYMDKIEFQIAYIRYPSGRVQNVAGTWERIINTLLESPDFGERLHERRAIAETVETLIKGKDTPKEKMLAIYDFVIQNIKLEKDDSWIMASKSISKIMSSRSGTHSDNNILLGAMLNAAGLKAKPVLISERSHGRVSRFAPLIDRFSHVIMLVQLDSNNTVLLDATETFRPAGTLPFAFLNGQGLVVEKGLPEKWVDLHQQKTIDFTEANCKIVDNQLVINIKTMQRGLSALQLRHKLAKETPENVTRERYAKLLGTKGTVKEVTYDNIEKVYETLKSSCELKTNEWGESSEERIYFNPMLTFGEPENPFKSPKREFPIDFGELSDDNYSFNFTIPEGYEVEELPKTARMVLGEGDIKFDFIVVQNGNNIKLSSKLQIKKAIILATEYSTLREFFGQINVKHNEQIVLKKK